MFTYLYLFGFCVCVFCSSYTAALGVTVGVGCLLLVLNMLIFAGIYYQRERSRRKIQRGHCGNGTTSANGGSPIDNNGMYTNTNTIYFSKIVEIILFSFIHKAK